MRRRAFLDDEIIDLSREFVCLRLNAWRDDEAIARASRLQGTHQNSVLALIDPRSEAIRSGRFPEQDDCDWGPMAFYSTEGAPAWVGTAENVKELEPAMRDLLARCTERRAPESRALPVLADLDEGLNIAACDNRALILSIASEPDGSVERELVPLAFAPALAGRAHFVRLAPSEFRAALESGRIERAGDADPTSPGLAVVRPHAYGQTGTLCSWAPADSDAAQVQHAIQQGLRAFAEEFTKGDRSAHIIEGHKRQIFWDDHDASDWRRFLND